MMKTKNKMNWVLGMRAGLLAMALAAALSLAGCGGGGSTSSTSTTTWPPATPPATSETNTYIGTQSPGLYTVTIDHTGNTFSYQDLADGSVAVTGSFTTTANGFLALTTAGGQTGYALEQLSRAVLLVPPLVVNQSSQVALTSAPVFAVAAPVCQVIPTRAKFEYIATANPYYASGSYYQGESYAGSGLVTASSASDGQAWEFGGQIEYQLPNAAALLPPGIPIPYSFPDPFTATCAAGSQGTSVIQTSITVPSSLSANYAIGPTGFLIEDHDQSDKAAFIGAVAPASPIDLTQLNGATFLGVNTIAGSGSGNVPQVYSPSLVSFTSSGAGTLTGGAYPSNDPAQTPATNYTLNLGAQDPANNGYFPSATITNNGSNGSGVPISAYALVTNAGGKYSIFVTTASGAFYEAGWILFQQ